MSVGAIRKREIDLDVVRGLAILLAMGWHLNGLPVTSIGAFLLAPGRAFGWAGVDLFFVLSGFLIGRLVIGEVQRHGDFDFGSFMVRRILRLWPVVYVFLLAMILVNVAPAKDFAWQVALHIQNLVPVKSAAHLWSLAVEEHFYLVLGAAFPLVFLRLNWRTALPVTLLAIVVLCPLLRYAAVHSGFSPTAVQVQTQFRLDALAGGVMLAYLSREAPDLFAALLRDRWKWAIAAVAGGTFLWMVPKDTMLGQTAGFTISWLTSVAVLMLLYKSGVEGYARRPCLALAFLGQVSYPLYLWHVPVLKLGSKLFERVLGPNLPGLETAAIYAGSIAVAFLMAKYLEQPLIQLRDRIAPARSAAPAAAEIGAASPVG